MAVNMNFKTRPVLLSEQEIFEASKKSAFYGNLYTGAFALAESAMVWKIGGEFEDLMGAFAFSSLSSGGWRRYQVWLSCQVLRCSLTGSKRQILIVNKLSATRVCEPLGKNIRRNCQDE